MALGVLGVSGQAAVPGTSHVYDDAHSTQQGQVINPNLKYDRSGKEPIILVPQPSDDPNDPLNWPLWKRDMILSILCVMSVIASTLSPLLAADTLALALLFTRTFREMALATGYHLVGVAVAGVICVPSARIWGKRHLYLLGTIIIIISSAWGGASGTNYGSLVGARVFQGIGLAPFEALVNVSVGDLFYVHERGKRMALSNMSLFGGAFFTPILVGKITDSLGWPWSFYLISIFAGAVFPFLFFFCPETAFRRPEYLSTDLGGTTLIANSDAVQAISAGAPMDHAKASHEGQAASEATSLEKHSEDVESRDLRPRKAVPDRATFKQSLALFNGRKSDDAFWRLALRPFPLFLNPAIVWGCLIQGCLIGWTVMIGVVLAAILISPPLYFTELQTGYMYTGAFVGAVLGFFLAGILADWTTKLMIKRNGGVFEPEFRIVLVIPQMILGCAGLYGFGIVASNVEKYGWFWPDFFFALEVMGMVLGAVASGLYLVDAHRDIAIEAFTCLLIFKNMFSFALTFGAYDWIIAQGIQKTFIIVASIQVGVCVLSIPMYVLGKKHRYFAHRHSLIKALRLG